MVRILPRPAQPPGPAIVTGGSSKAAAERAAGIADGYHPPTEDLYDDYRQAKAALGDGRALRRLSPRDLHLPASLRTRGAPQASQVARVRARWPAVR